MQHTTDKPSAFTWEGLGDIEKGRETIGSDMPVLLYRLFQYSLKDVLVCKYDDAAAAFLFRSAGHLAGMEFAKNMLNLSGDFDYFVANLTNTLRELKVGYLRIEKADLSKLSFTLTVEEDLDCSGLPISGQTVCDYDEGFIAGILEAYSGHKFNVNEIDCWATGGRICRFYADSEQS